MYGKDTKKGRHHYSDAPACFLCCQTDSKFVGILVVDNDGQCTSVSTSCLKR
jgi:hypothetical protein